jgi:hypothetical protein
MFTTDYLNKILMAYYYLQRLLFPSVMGCEPNSSVSIVSGYRLGDRGSIPSRGERIFPLASVQTGSGAHPAYCTMGTGGPFPGAKTRSGRDADHSPHLVPRLRMSRSYISSPPSAFMGCSETA